MRFMADPHRRSHSHNGIIAERARSNAAGITRSLPVQLSPHRLGKIAGRNLLRIRSHLSLRASSARHSKTQLRHTVGAPLSFTRGRS